MLGFMFEAGGPSSSLLALGVASSFGRTHRPTGKQVGSSDGHILLERLGQILEVEEPNHVGLDGLGPGVGVVVLVVEAAATDDGVGLGLTNNI